MIYFKNDTHGLYMARSRDGCSFTDADGAQPIMAGDTIAQQKSIRDRQITHGTEVAFLLAMTDLHVFLQKKGTYRACRYQVIECNAQKATPEACFR